MVARWKRWRLESKRRETFINVRVERSLVEDMILRAKFLKSDMSATIEETRTHLADINEQVARATSKEELDDLADDAEAAGHNRAYICPPTEIDDEGSLRIGVMAEWGVPRLTIQHLRETLGQKTKNEQDIGKARSALRAIYEESDSWSSYFDDYHTSMWRYTWWLFCAIAAMTPGAILLAHWPHLVLASLFLAGGIGSCASVVSKVPVPELRLSGEFQSYLPRILGRIGAGTVVSLVACSILGWGIPVPVRGETFATMLQACSISPRPACTEFEMLFLLGVAMGFGFTERLVAHFEGPWFGQFRRSSSRRDRRSISIGSADPWS